MVHLQFLLILLLNVINMVANYQMLKAFLKKYALAMDLDDVKFCQKYFQDEEKRDPTISEIRLIDSYWSDHCRHTTFLTAIDEVKIGDKIEITMGTRTVAVEVLQIAETVRKDDAGAMYKEI